jgi:hypothetical protein
MTWPDYVFIMLGMVVAFTLFALLRLFIPLPDDALVVGMSLSYGMGCYQGIRWRRWIQAERDRLREALDRAGLQ